MCDFSQLNDEKLLVLIKEGDHHAYAYLYDRFWPVLYMYARKMTDDKEEAQDILQEVFTRLWDKCGQINLTGSLSSYLYAAVRYQLFDLNDRKKIRANYINSLQCFIDEGVYITDEHIREKELAAQIEKEIASLPPKMREVFELSRNTDMTYKKIGEQLHISDKTVKKQVGNAVKILRLKLGIAVIGFLMIVLAR